MDRNEFRRRAEKLREFAEDAHEELRVKLISLANEYEKMAYNRRSAPPTN